MREEVSFGSGESEPLRHLIKFEKMTDISQSPANAIVSTDEFSYFRVS